MPEQRITLDRVQTKRSRIPGRRPPSLEAGEEFVNLADRFRLIGDGDTSPDNLQAYPLLPQVGDIPGLSGALGSAAEAASSAEQRAAEIGIRLDDSIRSQGICRADIPQIVIPTISFTVSGYDAIGDAGYGAPYVQASPSAPAAIQDKAGRWFGINGNVAQVRPEWFGAVPWMGVPAVIRDSTVGGNAAEAFASSVGAPVVWSRGVYWTRGFVKRGRSDWIGAGVGRTILRLLPSTTANAVVAGLNAFSLRGGTSVTQGVFEFEISKLSIDGNRGAQQVGGSTDGLGLYGAVFKISEVEILNCSGWGMWTEFPFGGIPSQQKNVQSQFYNMYVHENKNGIHYGGPNDSEFYSVYSYLNDGTWNLRTYGAGSGKFTSCHTWCDAVGGPQVTTGVELSSPGNILIGCALEGAKREQVWARANNQTFLGCYLFYNQLSVQGVKVAGLRIGDNGTGEGTGGVAEVQLIRFSGKIQNCDMAVQLSQDRGYHTLDVDGFTVRPGATALSGQQWLISGLPTSDLKIAIQAVSDGVNPAPAPIAFIRQIVAKPTLFNGMSILSGALGIGVTTPNAPLDHVSGRWHRETETVGSVLTETFPGGGACRLNLGKLRGQDPFGNLSFAAYGVDQFALTGTGVSAFVAPLPGDSAANAAGGALRPLKFKGDGTVVVQL